MKQTNKHRSTIMIKTETWENLKIIKKQTGVPLYELVDKLYKKYSLELRDELNNNVVKK